MRFHRRLVFNPPLAAPIEPRAQNVLAELSSHGFVHARRSGTRVEFGAIPVTLFARSTDEVRAKVIVGGSIHLHPSGRHADLELECTPNHAVLAALICAVLVMAPVPALLRAFALAYAIWAVVDPRRGVPPLAGWVGRAAQAQLPP